MLISIFPFSFLRRTSKSLNAPRVVSFIEARSFVQALLENLGTEPPRLKNQGLILTPPASSGFLPLDIPTRFIRELVGCQFSAGIIPPAAKVVLPSGKNGPASQEIVQLLEAGSLHPKHLAQGGDVLVFPGKAQIIVPEALCLSGRLLSLALTAKLLPGRLLVPPSRLLEARKNLFHLRGNGPPEELANVALFP
jgi:hypothetical protein